MDNQLGRGRLHILKAKCSRETQENMIKANPEGIWEVWSEVLFAEYSRSYVQTLARILIFSSLNPKQTFFPSLIWAFRLFLFHICIFCETHSLICLHLFPHTQPTFVLVFETFPIFFIPVVQQKQFPFSTHTLDCYLFKTGIRQRGYCFTSILKQTSYPVAPWNPSVASANSQWNVVGLTCELSDQYSLIKPALMKEWLP